MTLRQAKYLTLDDLLIEAAFWELYHQAVTAAPAIPDEYEQERISAEIRRELNERRQSTSTLYERRTERPS